MMTTEVLFSYDGTHQELVWDLEEAFRTDTDVTIQFDGSACDFFVQVNTVDISSDAGDALFFALEKKLDGEDEADDAWDSLDGRVEWYVQELDNSKFRFVFDQYLFWTDDDEDGDFEITENESIVLESWSKYIMDNVIPLVKGAKLV